ncbi:MAG: SDR family oxidoreductase [Chitinophagaceae bacterium]|nr:SDR family oxidoreductase [Chitinophagaceae bacterium]
MKKTILITGASSGIGKATAKLFSEKGWNVVATMRTPEKEEELTKLENIFVTKLDVQDETSVQQAIQQAMDKFGSVDVLLNNAGYGLAGVFEAISKEAIERQFATNVFGLFDVTRAMLPHFRKQGSGIIINVTSVGGRMTLPLFSMYHASKFAVEGFSESLQYELAPTGIKVKVVEPGSVATDFSGRSLDMHQDPTMKEYDGFTDKIVAAFQKRREAGVGSTPDMTAAVIYEAATDGTDTLRYRAGADAEQILTARATVDDITFFNLIREQFAL